MYTYEIPFEVERYTKQQGLIAGCGAIGSHLAYVLGRMDWDLRLVDPDVVEAKNLTNQWIAPSAGLSIGDLKVEVLQSGLYTTSPEIDVIATVGKAETLPENIIRAYQYLFIITPSSIL